MCWKNVQSSLWYLNVCLKYFNETKLFTIKISQSINIQRDNSDKNDLRFFFMNPSKSPLDIWLAPQTETYLDFPLQHKFQLFLPRMSLKI